MIKVFGDSHSRIFKKCNIVNHVIDCENISGATLAGLPKRISTLDVKNRMINYLKNNKPNFLILKFGQVDIDLSYYYKIVVKKEKIDKSKYIQNLLSCYERFIVEVSEYIDKKRIIIFGINPPSLVKKESCYIYTSKIVLNKNKNLSDLLRDKIESIQERTYFSKLFNIQLEKMCCKNDIKFIEVFDEFLNSENIVADMFTNNNDHHLKGIETDKSDFAHTTKLFQEKLESVIK
jgi:hypothetical protein